MTKKSQLVERVPELLLGKIVRVRDGHRIGRIKSLGEQSFEIERGLFKHRRFRLDYDEITSALGNSVYVAVDPETLNPEPEKQAA